jgi:hypothetical protein
MALPGDPINTFLEAVNGHRLLGPGTAHTADGLEEGRTETALTAENRRLLAAWCRDEWRREEEMRELRAKGFTRMLFESCNRMARRGRHNLVLGTYDSWQILERDYIATGDRGPLRAAWRRHCERLRHLRHYSPVPLVHHLNWWSFDHPTRAYYPMDLNGVDQINNTELADMADADRYLAPHAQERRNPG